MPDSGTDGGGTAGSNGQDGGSRRPIRLLHLSDVHFGAEDREALAAVEEFTKRIKPDAIIIAGDITQSGRRREFEAAREWFDSLGVPPIVAPGNHDTPVYHLPARMIAPFDRYARYMTGLDAVGKLVELGGGLVRISAINTARGIQGRVNWADGVIALDDLEEALERLKGGPEGAWRILVCHHPLVEPSHAKIAVDTRRGGEALRRCAAAKVDAILTGHIHDAFAHPIEAARRPMVQMGSGTLSTRLRATRPAFCVIQIDGEHMVQDICTIDRNGLEIKRNYDSAKPGDPVIVQGGTPQAEAR
ncbi:MAG TPA: metallophosphoesterase [Hyphomonadaceae bacterium]|jgi:3',5'-cyclic AMP phosphodiesterase CpdA|nr:metallophosphoesterase [Hyphomonadaceae bacterium]